MWSKALLAGCVALAFGLPTGVSAHGKHRGHHHGKPGKYTYDDGVCRVSVKQKHGRYEERRRCRGPVVAYGDARPVYVAPAPSIVIAPTGRTYAPPAYAPPAYAPAPAYAPPPPARSGWVDPGS